MKPVYVRENDGATMIEVWPGHSINIDAALKSGLINEAEYLAAQRARRERK